MERLLLAAGGVADDARADVGIIPLSEAAALGAFQLARRLRATGMRCELEAAGRSVKSAMRRADKLGVRFAILLGDDELRAGRATVRDMRRQRDHPCVLALDGDGAALRAVLATLAAETAADATKGATGV